MDRMKKIHFRGIRCGFAVSAALAVSGCGHQAQPTSRQPTQPDTFITTPDPAPPAAAPRPYTTQHISADPAPPGSPQAVRDHVAGASRALQQATAVPADSALSQTSVVDPQDPSGGVDFLDPAGLTLSQAPQTHHRPAHAPRPPVPADPPAAPDARAAIDPADTATNQGTTVVRPPPAPLPASPNGPTFIAEHAAVVATPDPDPLDHRLSHALRLPRRSVGPPGLPDASAFLRDEQVPQLDAVAPVVGRGSGGLDGIDGRPEQLPQRHSHGQKHADVAKGEADTGSCRPDPK